MSTPTAQQQLHDRATRGEVLSAEEQAQLEAWYAQLDREEGVALARAAPPASLTALRAQLEIAVGQIATGTQHIQGLTTENAAMRQEIAALQRLLAQKPTLQPT